MGDRLQPRLARVVTCVVAGLIGTAGPSEAADLIRLDGGLVYPLSARATPAEARIPITPQEGITFGGLQFLRNDARLSDDRVAWFVDAFDIEPQEPTDDRGPAILLKLREDVALEPGTYHVQIKVLYAGRDAQVLPLQIIQPAAQFRSVGEIRVHKVLPFLGRWGPDDRKAELFLSEVSKDADVTSIEITSQRVKDEAGRPATGSIRFVEPSRVEAGKSVKVPYTLEDGFGVGKTTVDAEIDAPQLGSTVAMVVVVSVVRHGAWVAVLILLGVLVGWLVRTFLPRKIERANADLSAARALRRLRDVAQGRADPTFRATMTALRERLREAADAGKAKGLVEAAQQVEAATEAAVAELEQRAALAAGELGDLTALVARRWQLPPSIGQAVVPARDRLAAIVLDTGNPEPARMECEAARRDLQAGLPAVVQDWHRRARRQQQSLAAARSPVVRRVLSDLDLGPLGGALDEVHTVLTGTTTEDIGSFLEPVQSAFRQQQEAVDQLMFVVGAVFGELIRRIGDPSSTPAIDQLRREFRQFGAAAVRYNDDPDEVVALFLERAESLHDALAGAIKAISPSADADADVRNALDEGDYERAVNAARAARASEVKSVGGEGVRITLERVGSDRLDAVGSPEPLLPAWPDRTPALMRTPSPLHVEAPRAPLEIQLDEARIKRQVFWANLIQTGVFGVIITLVGFQILAPDFVGTPGDFTKVFLWGFSFDVGASAVAKVLGQVN